MLDALAVPAGGESDDLFSRAFAYDAELSRRWREILQQSFAAWRE